MRQEIIEVPYFSTITIILVFPTLYFTRNWCSSALKLSGDDMACSATLKYAESLSSSFFLGPLLLFVSSSALYFANSSFDIQFLQRHHIGFLWQFFKPQSKVCLPCSSFSLLSRFVYLQLTSSLSCPGCVPPLLANLTGFSSFRQIRLGIYFRRNRI